MSGPDSTFPVNEAGEPSLARDPHNGRWHVVGSALDADIHLDGAAPRHVRVRRLSGSRLELIDLGAASGVFADGERVSGSLIVPDSAEIKLGSVILPADRLPDDVIDSDDLPVYSAPITIGRDPSCEFVVEKPTVSAHHARLTRTPEGLVLEDLDSSNGTYVDGRRVKRAQLGWRQPFYVGTTWLTPLEVIKRVRSQRAVAHTFVMSAAVDLDEEVEAESGLLKDRTIAGRGEEADLVIDSPAVSARHALIERVDKGFRITDLGSTNGTYVNGVRITEPTVVPPDATIYLGSTPLALGGGTGEREKIEGSYARGIRIDVQGVKRVVGKGKVVVDDVALTVLPGEMVALMGPSGAGKTSLLTTLAGYTPPTEGQVLFNGLDLYQYYDLFRLAVGYVPQEDVMHRTLTAAEVLQYTGRLNYPDDATDDEIEERARRVLRQLDLSHVADSVVGDAVVRGLSGGQRKRLNVGMELMNEPLLLLLDEPTSGLDGRSAMQLIRQCRGLANTGRTVLMTIHQPRQEAFDLFDKVLFLTAGGKLAYFGPPSHVREYFAGRGPAHIEARNPADYALEALDPPDRGAARSAAEWADDYRDSQLFVQYVQRRQNVGKESSSNASGTPPKRGAWKQFLILTRRYARVKLRDRGAVLIQLFQAPLIGAITALLFHRGRFVPIIGDDDITPSLFVLVASAVWFGTSNVAREIVGERAIFAREAKRALRAGPYLGSIAVVQAGLMLLQLLLLLLIVQLLVGLEGSFPMLLLVVCGSGFSAMAMGLFLSSMARSQLAAVVLVPLLILPQILLSGQLAPVGGDKGETLTEIVAAPMLLRWSYSAITQVEFAEAHDSTGQLTYRAEQGPRVILPRLGFEDDPSYLPLGLVLLFGAASLVGTHQILRRRSRSVEG